MKPMVAWSPAGVGPELGVIAAPQGSTLTMDGYLSRLAARLDDLYEEAEPADRREATELLMEAGLIWEPLDQQEMRPGLQILQNPEVLAILGRKLSLWFLKVEPIVKGNDKEAEQAMQETSLLDWVIVLLESEQLIDRA